VSIFAICPSASALKFDGVDDYVNCGNDSSLNISDEITVSAWVKVSGTIKYWKGIVDKWVHDAGDMSYGLFLHDKTGKFNFGLTNNGSNDSFVWSNSAHDIGEWYHVVGVRRGNTQYLYINSIEQADKKVFTGTIWPSTTFLEIGAYEEGRADTCFNGTIDEVAIFNRALSAEEIRVLMHNRPDTDEPNLVGYWDFDEGEGQIAYDKSGNGNDGVLGSSLDPDDSDPVWIEPGAPIEFCTIPGFVDRELFRALAIKDNILNELEEAMAIEQSMNEILDELFKSGEYGDLFKGDVNKAKQKIHSAMQQEEQAETAVDQSIDKLDDALDALGIE
jgi:hypothetical protein